MHRAISAGLTDMADPDRAIRQQAYMKSAMPYAGLSTPILRKLCKDTFKQLPLTDPDTWQATVAYLWRNASVREMRHAAIELLLLQRYKAAWLSPEVLPLLREMVASGAWWDYVDRLAVDGMGHLLRQYPQQIKPVLRQWATDEDLWIRRAAILAQLKFKTDTDETLLWDCIEGSIADQNFFARKAIGWALREYAKTSPDQVVRYVHENRTRLSALSKREGLKVLLKQGQVAAVP